MDKNPKPETIGNKTVMRGELEAYANPSLREKEEGAWERAAVQEHDCSEQGGHDHGLHQGPV